MERVDFLLEKAYKKFLEGLPGTLSDHLRRAVDEYIKRLKSDKTSASLSQEKDGELDG